MKTLAFIPARGGSRGIKNKNLIKINKKPLIKYTIDLVKKFKILDIFISSDSKKIINYCKNLGVEIHYKRPVKLSNSKTSMYKTVKHGLDWLKKRGKTYDNILLLQPTNPLRNKEDLQKILKLSKKKSLSSLASVTKIREHPSETIFLKNKKKEFLLKSKKKLTRRQDFDKNYYFIDGTYYLFKEDFFKKNKNFVSIKKTYFYKLKNTWPIDIDTKDDAKVAANFLND